MLLKPTGKRQQHLQLLLHTRGNAPFQRARKRRMHEVGRPTLTNPINNALWNVDRDVENRPPMVQVMTGVEQPHAI
jgi:hypothetical protein